jgi:cobalamin biosynthesis Mg chelatase CobN
MKTIEQVRAAVGDAFLVRQAGENFALELKGNPSAANIEAAKASLEELAKANGLRAGTTTKTVVTFWLNQATNSSSAAKELAELKAQLAEMQAQLAAAAAAQAPKSGAKGRTAAATVTRVADTTPF